MRHSPAATVYPRHIKVLLTKELPRSCWVDAGQVPIEYSTPTSSDSGGWIETAFGEEGAPLFLYECRSSCESGGRREGKHMNTGKVFSRTNYRMQNVQRVVPLDILRVRPEVGALTSRTWYLAFAAGECHITIPYMINLILKNLTESVNARFIGWQTATYDTSDLVADKVGWLVRIVVPKQKVIVQGPGQYRQHQISPGLHTGITRHLSPHLDCVREESVFAAAFFVFAIGALE